MLDCRRCRQTVTNPSAYKIIETFFYTHTFCFDSLIEFNQMSKATQTNMAVVPGPRSTGKNEPLVFTVSRAVVVWGEGCGRMGARVSGGGGGGGGGSLSFSFSLRNQE